MKEITEIPEGLEIDFHGGFIYNIKAFDNFIERNKIIIIPNDFFQAHSESINHQYKDRSCGDFYSFNTFKNNEISNRYRNLYHIPFDITPRVRRSIHFGRNIRWNNNRTTFYIDFNLEEMLQ